MASKKAGNQFIPNFVSNDLLWYERAGLNTWYERGKCQDFLENTDNHFKNLQMEKLMIEHHEIMNYPPERRE